MDNTNSQEIVYHFSKRSEVYDESGSWVNDNSILSAIVNYLPQPQNNKIDIVDLGAGTGAVSKYILKHFHGHKSIAAVDICPDMLAKIVVPEIKTIVSPLEQLPFSNNTFDVAVSRQCLHYIHNIGQAIKEIKRVIKKDGSFILSQIVPVDNKVKDYWCEVTRFRQPLRQNYYTEKEWLDLFKNEGFRPVFSSHFSHRGSVLKWAKKYKVTDKHIIQKYKDLLTSAPKQFIEEYNVLSDSNDVFYDSFWIVIKFELRE